MLRIATALLGCTLLAAPASAQTRAPARAPARAQEYDVVVRGGRVIDPESGLDAVRSVGIRGGRVAYVGTGAIRGRQQVDATGLVVAPGFIDLHRHSHHDVNMRYQALDGVTSALELEVGTADVEAWYASRAPGRLVNYGVAIGHIPVRMKVLGDSGQFLPSGPAQSKDLTEPQREELLAMLETGLRQGAPAVGMGLAYTPAASAMEALSVYRVAARHKAAVHIHLRGGGVSSLVEAIGDAAISGAPLHVVHVNSTGGSNVTHFLAAIEGARARGLDVTTEAYPYTAGATRIESALFNGWEQWPDERFQRLQWAATGERLTRETFAKYRAVGGGVIQHGNTEVNVTAAVRHPLTMIASDGGGNAEGVPTHPRGSGTYARILGRYVRDSAVLDLKTALAKMTIMPARRLEGRVPDMKDRGRVRVGAWADLAIFDPKSVADQSTYEKPALFSTGIRHVYVNGVAVVKDGAVVDGVAPGRPIRAAIADAARAAVP